MEFDLTEEEQAILATVDRLVARHLPLPEQRRRDAAHDPPYHLMPVLAEAGLLRLPFPEALGGLDAPWRTMALVQERLGQCAWMLGSLLNRTIGFGGMGLLHYAQAHHRDTLLPPLMEGRLLFALALTEAQAGSDAAALTTRAERTAQGWRLTGQKLWVSDAARADYIVTAARSDPESRRAKGITLFLVPQGAPGLHLTEIPKIGNNGLPSFELRLDGTPLPETAVFGHEGQGFAHLAQTLRYARAGMAAATTGYAQAALDIALEHAKTRRQFGQPLAAFQTIAHRLADMAMRVDQSRLMARHLALGIDRGADTARLAAEAKVVATETLQFVADQGMQILASAGYHAESDMARIWRDARLYSFGEGSNEIQRTLIARALGLELP